MIAGLQTPPTDCDDWTDQEIDCFQLEDNIGNLIETFQLEEHAITAFKALLPTEPNECYIREVYTDGTESEAITCLESDGEGIVWKDGEVM